MRWREHPVAAGAQDGPPVLAIDGPLATISLRRPATHNRIEPQDVPVLLGHIEQLDQNADVRAVVLSSAGRSFSSGFDLTRIGNTGTAAENLFETLVDALENCRAVTIARLHAPVYGGSTDLALACDFRLGAKGIHMVMPAARLGLHYYGHGMRRWVARLGLGPAKRLFLLGRPLDAEAMLQAGYLDALAQPEDLDGELNQWIADILSTAPFAASSMKQTLNQAARGEYDHDRATAAYHASLSTQDFEEGIAAFAQKRPPRFTGK